MRKTRTMFHPTLGSAREVPEERVEEWAAQGWRKTKPKAVSEPVKAEKADDTE